MQPVACLNFEISPSMPAELREQLTNIQQGLNRLMQEINHIADGREKTTAERLAKIQEGLDVANNEVALSEADLPR